MKWIKKHYKYVAEKDYQFHCPELIWVVFQNEWCKISNGTLTVKKGYAWDGCSPKKEITLFGKSLVVGVWDGKNDQCKWPSCVHDIFCQFIDIIRVSKKVVVSIFRRMLREAKWWLWRQWVWAVDKFGPQIFLLDKLQEQKHGNVNNWY